MDSLEYFYIEDVRSKKPEISFLDSLVKYESQGLGSLLYTDGTLLIEQDAFMSKPFLLGKLNSEISAEQKLISALGVTSKEVISSEINRARVLAQSNKNDEDETLTLAQKMVEQIAEHAIMYSCSDVHIFLRNPNVEIRFRKKGVITPPSFSSFDYDSLSRMVSRLFQWTGANNSENEFSLNSKQSTTLTLQIKVNKKEVPTRLRIELLPLEKLGDAKIVLRVSPAVQSKNMQQMNVDPVIASIMSDNMKKPSGLVIITGPTGSGKTTFLHAGLHEIPPTSICNTLEDPVEVIASFNPLISQHNRDTMKGYNEQITSLLRLDPDIMVIGEMRDEESASSTVRASLTGHLAITTLHTNNAVGAIPRLKDLGISYSDLALPDMLALLVAIRLAPTLCDRCKIPVYEVPEVEDRIKDNKKAKLDYIYTANPKGCRHCDNGFSERVPIIEYINVDDGLREYIEVGDLKGAVKYLRDNNWQSLSDIAWKKINQGQLCPVASEKQFKNIYQDAGDIFIYEEAYKELEGAFDE